MRRETTGVTESLLQAAKEEFLTYGFHDASMRRISAACGVSTNSIYTRFGDNSLPMDSTMPACGGYRRHAESVPIPYIPGLATRADFSPQ